MECPHCSWELKLPAAPEHNVLTYGSPELTVTLCCGYGATLHRVQHVRVEAYTGRKREDDWGKKLKKRKSDVSV